MNNGEEDVFSVISDALEYGIEIIICKNFTECRNLLSSSNSYDLEYDAVILNAFCKMINELPKPDQLDCAINWLEGNCSRIPWFVVNTKTDMERRDKTVLNRTLKSRYSKMYLANESKWELFDKIRERVELLPHRKYAKELCVCREQERESLLSLLRILSQDGKDMERDHRIPNECRKVLEGIRNNFNDGAIYIPSITRPIPALDTFSTIIGSVKDGVPEYVKRSFHTCCRVSQDGSHINETDKLIKEGKAPFLTKSLILDLLNILNWLSEINK